MIEILHIFGKSFLTSPYEYSIGGNDDVMPSRFCTRFNYRKFKKNLVFRYDKVNLTFYPSKINEELYFLRHISIQGILLPEPGKKLIFFKISCMMRVINCEVMTSSPH